MYYKKHFIIQSIFTIALFMSTTISAQVNSYKEVQLTNTNSDNRYASYNKDGEVIVFESNRDGHWQVYIMDVNGNKQERIIVSESNDRRPTWHPYKNIILDLLLGILKETSDPVIDIAISHDWYMYVLKEHFLKQPLEEFGQVQYLEGAAIFEKQGKLYIVNHQSDPVLIEQS